MNGHHVFRARGAVAAYVDDGTSKAPVAGRHHDAYLHRGIGERAVGFVVARESLGPHLGERGQHAVENVAIGADQLVAAPYGPAAPGAGHEATLAPRSLEAELGEARRKIRDERAPAINVAGAQELSHQIARHHEGSLPFELRVSAA